jgi:hypothetical protein
MDKDYIGEVIESSTGDFLAECLELNSSPPFGSFVKVAGRSPTIGLVFSVSTHSIEPNRRPTAYGKTEEELRLEQPQIFELLKTEFRALITGYIDTTGAHPFLPPQPPRIHSFVHPCDADEVRMFTDTSDYLRAIMNAPRLPTDDLLIASVRGAWMAHNRDTAYLVAMGKDLSRLIRDDYDRLSSIIRRIAQ